MVFFTTHKTKRKKENTKGNILIVEWAGIRKAVRHARMAHKATKWPGPVMHPDRTKLVKYTLFCEKDFNL